ncbi:MAG: hypothetical protein AB1529_00840 [Candidatus Micrarchaeota archaeon]
MVQTTARAGVAYGVLKCSDPRPFPALAARFKEALENIKAAHDETGIPPETEFSVFDLRSGIAFSLLAEGAHGLAEKAEPLEKQGANFMIRSTLPMASNGIAARDLGDVLNMLYGATELFDAENEGREKRVMDVFYRDEKGAYVSQLGIGLAQEGRS